MQAGSSTTPRLEAVEFVDNLQIGLIGLSFIIAMVLPLELLLFSYGILGPAHYLTQISWLNDRKFFTHSRWVALPFMLLTVLIMTKWLAAPVDFFAMSVCLAVSVVMLRNPLHILAAAALGFGILYLMGWVIDVSPLFFFVPTFIHVFVFTAAFMLLGALRAQSRSGYLAFMFLLGLGLLCFLIPGRIFFPVSDYARINIEFIDQVFMRLARLLDLQDSPDGILQAARFAAFAYTYHYLNWFSKTKIIGWSKGIDRRRLLAFLAVYAGAVGVYLYDYGLGFKLLLFLSILHVMLELPLNVVCFRAIGSHFRGLLAR